MTLKNPVNFQAENAAQICLPSPTNNYAGNELGITSWGLVRTSTPDSMYLQLAKVIEVCLETINDDAFSDFDMDHELCSKNQEGHGQTYYYDDGGWYKVQIESVHLVFWEMEITRDLG